MHLLIPFVVLPACTENAFKSYRLDNSFQLSILRKDLFDFVQFLFQYSETNFTYQFRFHADHKSVEDI